MANLTSDKNLDKHLKVIKSGEEITSLELATEGNGAKIKGDLEITGRITNTVGMFELLGDKIVVNAGFLYFINLQNRLHFSENDVDSFYNMFFVSNSDTTLNVNNAKTKGIQTEVRGGTITAADTTNTYDSALNVSVTLNDSSDSGSCVYKLIEGVATNTDITGWDELYLLHLTGASTFYVDNAGNVALASGKKLYLDGGGDTYIHESGADILDFQVGDVNMLRLQENGASSTAAIAGRFRLTNHDGSTYDDTSASSVQTKAQIDAAISAGGGGGGTHYWQFTTGGYKTNASNTVSYYMQYYPNRRDWNNSDSSPTTINQYDAPSATFHAVKDGSITNIRTTGYVNDTGATDDFKFYVFKGAVSNDGTTTSLTLIATSDAITTSAAARTFMSSTDISSSNTFSEGDGLWVMLKKDVHTNNTDIYFSITISGEYS